MKAEDCYDILADEMPLNDNARYIKACPVVGIEARPHNTSAPLGAVVIALLDPKRFSHNDYTAFATVNDVIPISSEKPDPSASGAALPNPGA